MALNGPMGMYKVRPVFELLPDISLPSCMYKMDNLFGKTAASGNPDDLKLLEMEKHQLNVIQKLEDLKNKVIKLKEELNVPKMSEVPETFQDIVVRANPQSPPLSMWIFYHILSKSLPVRLVTYLHSSLVTLPENVKMLHNLSNSESCKVSLTVIWRDGDKDHEMMIDPFHQGYIEGEVNIARYISRLLSLNYDIDPVASTQIDNWLETAHSSIIHGNSKEKQAVLRSLNSYLGKCNYLVGNSITLADIIMWSAIVQTKLHVSLPANVTKWMKSLVNDDIFHTMNEIYVI